MVRNIFINLSRPPPPHLYIKCSVPNLFIMLFQGAPYKKYGAVKTFGTGKDGYSVGYANTNCVWGKKSE